MSSLVGAKDWSLTPLGPRLEWPASLGMAVAHGRIPDDGGGGVLSVLADETGRVRAEAAAARALRRLDAALLAGEVGTFEWDVTADRIWGDANFARMADVALDATGAVPLAAYMDRVHPDDRGRVWAEIERSFATGDDLSLELRLRAAGGGSRWVLDRGKPERDAGNLRRAAGGSA